MSLHSVFHSELRQAYLARKQRLQQQAQQQPTILVQDLQATPSYCYKALKIGGAVLAGGFVCSTAYNIAVNNPEFVLIHGSSYVLNKLLPNNPWVYMATDFATLYWMPSGAALKISGQFVQNFSQGLGLPAKMQLPIQLGFQYFAGSHVAAMGRHYVPEWVENYGSIVYAAGMFVQTKVVLQDGSKKLGEGVKTVGSMVGSAGQTLKKCIGTPLHWLWNRNATTASASETIAVAQAPRAKL